MFVLMEMSKLLQPITDLAGRRPGFRPVAERFELSRHVADRFAAGLRPPRELVYDLLASEQDPA